MDRDEAKRQIARISDIQQTRIRDMIEDQDVPPAVAVVASMLAVVGAAKAHGVPLLMHDMHSGRVIDLVAVIQGMALLTPKAEN